VPFARWASWGRSTIRGNHRPAGDVGECMYFIQSGRVEVIGKATEGCEARRTGARGVLRRWPSSEGGRSARPSLGEVRVPLRRQEVVPPEDHEDRRWRSASWRRCPNGSGNSTKSWGACVRVIAARKRTGKEGVELRIKVLGAAGSRSRHNCPAFLIDGKSSWTRDDRRLAEHPRGARLGGSS